MQIKVQTVYVTIFLHRLPVLQMCFVAFVTIYYFAHWSL